MSVYSPFKGIHSHVLYLYTYVLSHFFLFPLPEGRGTLELSRVQRSCKTDRDFFFDSYCFPYIFFCWLKEFSISYCGFENYVKHLVYSQLGMSYIMRLNGCIAIFVCLSSVTYRFFFVSIFLLKTEFAVQTRIPRKQ